MAGSSPLHILTLALLALPPFFLATYFFAQFPNPPEIPYVHPSLASLPKDHKSWQIYGEDFYPNGSYVLLPYGRVRLLCRAISVACSLLHGRLTLTQGTVLDIRTRIRPKGMFHSVWIYISLF